MQVCDQVLNLPIYSIQGFTHIALSFRIDLCYFAYQTISKQAQPEYAGLSASTDLERTLFVKSRQKCSYSWIECDYAPLAIGLHSRFRVGA
jgi:hypothetical protein